MHSKSRRYLAALAAALAFPAVALAQGQAPSASFSYAPESPRVGDPVTLASASCDPDGRLERQAWDLDGDGQFDDAEGPVADVRFSTPGAHTVALQVTSRGEGTDTQRRTVMVDTQYALPRPDSARLMSPFPVVTLAGRLTSSGARIKRLSVRAPVCARVVVRCRGRCPAKRVSSYTGRRQLRIRRFERELRAGTVLTIAVSKGAQIGKLTTFKIRQGSPPKRTDKCLRPGDRRGSRCPRA
jgi:PKD repeat protein